MSNSKKAPSSNNAVAGMTYDPLGEQVVATAITGGAKVDPELLGKPIPESSFARPNIEMEVDPLASGPTTNGKEPNQANTFVPPNPELSELPPRQKEMAAEQLVDFMLRGYGSLHKYGNKYLQISKKTIHKLQREGKINLQAAIPYDEGFVPLKDFIEEYNTDMSDFLCIDPEWKAEIRPPLVRIFKKRGLGMSDEQLVAVLFAQDIAVKTKMVLEMKSQTNGIIEFAIEQSQRMQAAFTGNTRPPHQPAQPGPIVSPDIADQREQVHQNSEQVAQGNYVAPVQDVIMGELSNTNTTGIVEATQVPQYGTESTVGALDNFVKGKAGSRNAPSKRKAGGKSTIKKKNATHRKDDN